MNTPNAPAVHAAVEYARGALPVYVPMGPSIAAGVAAALVVFIAGFDPLRDEFLASRRAPRDGTDPLVRFRWVVMLMLVLWLCNAVFHGVQGSVFYLSNLTENRQHFVNLKWIGMYRNALLSA